MSEPSRLLHTVRAAIPFRCLITYTQRAGGVGSYTSRQSSRGKENPIVS